MIMVFISLKNTLIQEDKTYTTQIIFFFTHIQYFHMQSIKHRDIHAQIRTCTYKPKINSSVLPSNVFSFLLCSELQQPTYWKHNELSRSALSFHFIREKNVFLSLEAVRKLFLCVCVRPVNEAALINLKQKTNGYQSGCIIKVEQCGRNLSQTVKKSCSEYQNNTAKQFLNKRGNISC